jgi:anti-sigma regulatory factor (Ser/Thr protein kinase)
VAAPYKFAKACAEFGYNKFNDDITVMLFGARWRLDGVYEATTPLSPALVDVAVRDMAAWCAARGWAEELSGRLQLVLGEVLMNVYDHGFDDLQRSKDVVGVRLRRAGDNAELTVWDCGRPPPSMKVAAGVTSTAFEIVNKGMSDHGRGRLMVRQLCSGIQRQRFGALNETVFYIPWNNAEEGVQTA